MSEFKGTKTKWNKMDASRLGIPFIIYNEKEETIFQCYGEDAKANALLISKAPELLEMLKKLVERLEENDLGRLNAVSQAKQLIKEATEL
jgi:hypothetical protein